MVDPLYAAPSLNSELSDIVFTQNLPSIVVSHVLDPQPGETILDMCSSPGLSVHSLFCISLLMLYFLKVEKQLT